MKMPWGKHKDKDLEDIFSSYLKWLIEDCNVPMDEELINAICLTVT